MHTAEECQRRCKSWQQAGRTEPSEREEYFGNRTISVTVTDLGVTFVTVLGAGSDPVREAKPDEPPADIRITADSDQVMSLAQPPMNIARAWVSGKVKIEASMKDLFRLRRLLEVRLLL